MRALTEKEKRFCEALLKNEERSHGLQFLSPSLLQLLQFTFPYAVKKLKLLIHNLI